jgi:excisionase family DNA binding protein
MQNLERTVQEINGEASRDWMTVKEAIAFLGITSMTLTAWAKKGVIEKQKVGGKVYLDSAEVRGLRKLSGGRVN